MRTTDAARCGWCGVAVPAGDDVVVAPGLSDIVHPGCSVRIGEILRSVLNDVR
jgi:hypothetical protein